MAFGTAGHETIKPVSVTSVRVIDGAAGGGSRVVTTILADPGVGLLFIALTTMV